MESNQNKPTEPSQSEPKARRETVTVDTSKPPPKRRRRVDGVEVIRKGKPKPAGPVFTAPSTAIFLHKTCGTEFKVSGTEKAKAYANECPECGTVSDKSILRLGTEFADGTRRGRGDFDYGLAFDRARSDEDRENIRAEAEKRGLALPG